MKETLQSETYAPGSIHSVGSHWLSGGVAGATAAAITNPLDVIRTTLQTQGVQGRNTSETRFRGMGDVCREIMAREGWRGFTRGWVPRVMFHVPGAAICWTAYEYFKDLFVRN